MQILRIYSGIWFYDENVFVEMHDSAALCGAISKAIALERGFRTANPGHQVDTNAYRRMPSLLQRWHISHL